VEALGIDASFWRDRSVLVTGHTGFKGAWLALWLSQMGARVSGYSLAPDTEPNLYTLLDVEQRCTSVIGDIRDGASFGTLLQASQPSVVFHMAAQSLVRRGYSEPVETFDVNVMGSVSVLEAIRSCTSVRSAVVVTTDKCYANEPPKGEPFRESDPLGGYDPYSASKAGAELVAAAYRSSFLARANVSVSTTRAGNVIGGGDWSVDRIVPDAVRAFASGTPLQVRNPDAVRPWQHVFEPLRGYLMLAQASESGDDVAQAWNFGPALDAELSVGNLVNMLQSELHASQPWQHAAAADAVHEASTLRLDSRKSAGLLGWRPRLTTDEAVRLTAQWYRRVLAGESALDVSLEQLRGYVA
jgi:CDP-glucose 4,6-dehydratase